MAANQSNGDFDTAIVGGGPAGLSAAIVLGRSCRRVVLFDHDKPRNFAAHAVHGYLGHDGIEPEELRSRGRAEAESYGAVLIDAEVVAAESLPATDMQPCGFQIRTDKKSFVARTILLATGVVDELPDIAGLEDFYGTSVHHCPYCDGWEHRGRKLATVGSAHAAAKLALELRVWSAHVLACTNGEPLSANDRAQLDDCRLSYREENICRLAGSNGVLSEIEFVDGSRAPCDALFFSADKTQKSPLAEMLGCKLDEEGMIDSEKKQRTCVPGVFLAGDADGDVQFAIVAAAEGAIAATAINELLQEDDQRRAAPLETANTGERT